MTPKVEGADAKVRVDAYLTGISGTEKVTFSIWDGDQVIAETIVPASEASAEMEIVGVHLWNGRKDPHLYTMKAVLAESGAELDSREVRFGCRTYEIDPERGFILNGAEYPLHGVSRHQDRPKKGNAISRADHEEDIALIMELGATTIRLAHYQHDQYFYDLCDEERSGHLGGDSLYFPGICRTEGKIRFLR